MTQALVETPPAPQRGEAEAGPSRHGRIGPKTAGRCRRHCRRDLSAERAVRLDLRGRGWSANNSVFAIAPTERCRWIGTYTLDFR